MKDDINKQIDFYINKSIQAFLLCIELYNKPTIDYRVEGSSYFLCNAWELLLKAKLLKEGKSINFKDKKNRSYSLAEAASKVMTNEKDPIRINLKVITSLRNTSTHSIIPEYDIIYTPFLSFSVKSYSIKLFEYFNKNISDYISSDFLSLFNNSKKINHDEIISKYGLNISNELENKIIELSSIIDGCGEASIAQKVDINIVRINNKSKADFTFYASNNSNDKSIQYIERSIDLNNKYPLTHHKIVNEVELILNKNNIDFTPIREPEIKKNGKLSNKFTTACLDLIIKEYDIKNNLDYSFKIMNGNTYIYKYSEKLITFIISLITDNKDLVINLKNKKS